jgi:hypothetical protein
MPPNSQVKIAKRPSIEKSAWRDALAVHVAREWIERHRLRA